MTGTGALAALDVADVSYRFGKRIALDHVSFAFGPGSFVVLLGLNGAGKTTLFSLITRLYVTGAGAIAVFGADIRQRPSEALSRMGVVFQQPTLDLDLTVAQNLRYHAALHGMSRREADERGSAELARIGLSDRRNDRVRALSGGQRRRIEIARALLHGPRLLLLDEPTVGLDVASRRSILDHVRTLCRTERLAVLWATHLIDEIDGGDRVVVLHGGRVLAYDSAAALCARTGADGMHEAFVRLVPEAAP